MTAHPWQEPAHTRRKARATIVSLVAFALGVCALVLSSAAMGAAAPARSAGSLGARARSVNVPNTPAGRQLRWLLGVAPLLPLSEREISAHFDSAFLAQVSTTELNQALESLGPPGSAIRLVSLSEVKVSSLVGLVEVGPNDYSVDLALDATGLIAGLFFKPVAAFVPKTWSQLERQLATVAPEVSFLAAKVNANGTCSPVHSLSPDSPRPLGSMFKLFVLGALANAVREHRISWNQQLTLTAAIKVGGSGTLQNAAAGTKLTVDQVALEMISVSDNTAADMLLRLVTRSAVENQVRDWSSHASLDVPFLTVSELFALKYNDFPFLAERYLSLSSAERARFLVSTVDKIPSSAERSASSPRDIGSIEWFASAGDICRALAGLATLESEPGLGPIDKVLSTNNGGIALSARTWPRIWFKGGSEPGVLTLGYLARDSRGQSFVVVVLSEDTKRPVQESAAVEIRALDSIAGAFGLLG